MEFLSKERAIYTIILLITQCGLAAFISPVAGIPRLDNWVCDSCWNMASTVIPSRDGDF